MKNPFTELLDRTALRGWIGKNRNLLMVRKRLSAQLPAKYRRGFYRTWVLSHMGVRRKHLRLPAGTLTPLTIKISPTMRCNLRCLGCFAGNYTDRDDMKFETMQSIVEQAEGIGIPSVGILGGEPLLLPKIFDLFRDHRKIGFYIATNGTLVTEEIVAKLSELPHVITAFSVDGFEEVNDKFRGRGVFRKVVRSMKLMKAGGVAFGFSTTVHKGNLDEVISARYLDFMIECGCLFGAFLPYVPVGTDPAYELVCSEDDVKEYYKKVDEILADRALLVLKEGYSDGTFLNSGCGAGHTLHITSSGEVEPCNGIQFFKDNILTSQLKDIYASPYFEDIRKLHPEDRRECLVIARPREVMEVVEKHLAAESHRDAMSHLEKYISTIGRKTSRIHSRQVHSS